MDKVSVDNLGKCSDCGDIAVLESLWEVTCGASFGQCQSCANSLNPASFGLRMNSHGAYERERWLGPTGWVRRWRPSEPFVLAGVQVRVSVLECPPRPREEMEIYNLMNRKLDLEIRLSMIARNLRGRNGGKVKTSKTG